jgi:hypothetical protein
VSIVAAQGAGVAQRVHLRVGELHAGGVAGAAPRRAERLVLAVSSSACTLRPVRAVVAAKLATMMSWLVIPEGAGPVIPEGAGPVNPLVLVVDLFFGGSPPVGGRVEVGGGVKERP